MSRRILLILSLLTLTTLGIAPEDAYGQSGCPIADSVDYPVDLDTFQMVQDYNVPSPRHQGRYHTGVDWHLAPGQSLGQPVRAIANGLVTYAFPLGWGRDGGVVIIQHTFEDGAVAWSQYGHIMETDVIQFPMRLTCVEKGEVIGVIGDARPAPHLHFEIRLFTNGGVNGDSPGPGYSWSLPGDGGWLDPVTFIERRQQATGG